MTLQLMLFLFVVFGGAATLFMVVLGAIWRNK